MSSLRAGRWGLVLAFVVPLAADAQAPGASRSQAIRRALEKAGPAIVGVRWSVRPFEGPLGPTGSGVVVDASRGLVATAGPSFGRLQADVVLPDGAVAQAVRVSPFDRDRGVVILQLPRPLPDLVEAELGDRPLLAQGDDVFATGRTANGRLLVSAGIVASERRPEDGGSEFAPFAIDARISEETAGGPLLDGEGRVVGLGVSPTGPVAGDLTPRFAAPRPEGFATAIPAAAIRRTLEAFGSGGARAFLGVRIGRPPRLEFGPAPARREGGAWIDEVVTDGPADRAGIRPGDVVKEVDGRPIPDDESLYRLVEAAPIGATLTLRVQRDGEELEIPVVTAPHPGRPLPPGPPPTPPRPNDDPEAGDAPPSVEPKTEPDDETDLPKPLP